MVSTIWSTLTKPSTLVGFGAVLGMLLLLMWILEPRAKAVLNFPVAKTQPAPFALPRPGTVAPWKKVAAYVPPPHTIPASTPAHASVPPPQKKIAVAAPPAVKTPPVSVPTPIRVHSSDALSKKTTVAEASAPIPRPAASPPLRALSAPAPKIVALKPVMPPAVKALPATLPAPVAAPSSDALPQKRTKPGLDCAKAAVQADRLICSDDELSMRDTELSALYRRAMGAVADQSALEAEQRDWIALHRNSCSTKTCLLSAYATRKKELLDWVGR